MRILGWVLFAATCLFFAAQGLFLAASNLPMNSYEVLVDHVVALQVVIVLAERVEQVFSHVHPPVVDEELDHRSEWQPQIDLQSCLVTSTME